MPEIKEIIQKFQSEEDSKKESKLLLNILRVLSTYYGVLWISELYGDLIKFYSYFGWPIDFDTKSLYKAVEKLEKAGLIESEIRIKAGYYNEVRKEKFLRLKNIQEVVNILSDDEFFVRFQNRTMTPSR
ncbi:MAG: hypothetical protein ACP6IS_10830 [Candidatus Asgardarchaeia archaeon]